MDAEQVLDDMRSALISAGHRVIVIGEVVPDPPVTILVAPGLNFAKYGTRPSDANFAVVCAVASGDRAVRTLLKKVYEVTEVLDGASGEYAVKEATPDSFPGPTGNLPCYIIEVEAELT